MTRAYIKHGGTAASNPDRPLWIMWHAARARARKEGVAFTISPDDIFIPAHCPVCDVKLARSPGKQGGGPTSPSLDRVVPEHGYQRENAWVICFGCNARKRNHWNLTYDIAFARYQATREDAA